MTIGYGIVISCLPSLYWRLTLLAGHEVVTDDDYYVELAEATVKHTRRALQPASFLVNLIPACE